MGLNRNIILHLKVLDFCASTAGSTCLIPEQGGSTCHMIQQKIKQFIQSPHLTIEYWVIKSHLMMMC